MLVNLRVIRVVRMRIPRRGQKRSSNRWTLTRITSSPWRSSWREAEMIPEQCRLSLYNQTPPSLEQRDEGKWRIKFLFNLFLVKLVFILLLLFKYSSYLNVHIKLLDILHQLIKTFITICQGTAESLSICKICFSIQEVLK